MGENGTAVDGAGFRPTAGDGGSEDERFEGERIRALRAGPGGLVGGLEHCVYCDEDIRKGVTSLKDHFGCSRHVRNRSIHHLIPFLEGRGVYRIYGKKEFFCEECGIEIDCKEKSLRRHVEEHLQESRMLGEGGEDDFRGSGEVHNLFKKKLWKVDMKSTSLGLNMQALAYRRLKSPFTLRDDSISNAVVGNVRSDVFSSGQLSMMTKAASYLERQGNAVEKDEANNRANMCVFGMRSTRGHTGW